MKKDLSEDEIEVLADKLTEELLEVVNKFQTKHLADTNNASTLSVVSVGTTSAMTEWSMQPINHFNMEFELQHLMFSLQNALSLSFSLSQQKMIGQLGRYRH